MGAGPAAAGASWQALGTSVVLRVTDGDALAAARAQVECELDAIDRACSRFRPDSELTRLNASAGTAVRASPLLMQALALALRAAALTDGDVDPTVGHALELAGYDRDWQLLQAPGELRPPSAQHVTAPAPAPALTARLRPGWQGIVIDHSRAIVRVPAGVRVDLGATAKALAADRAARAAQSASGSGVLVSIGGDIATAGAAPDGGWQIRVTDDHRSDLTAPGQTVRIRSGGLATSSLTTRRWTHRGEQMHHIMDPATQQPARSCWRTVSVAAADCAQANIATTAALLRADRAPAWLASLRLPARLVRWEGAVETVCGWPAAAEIRGPTAEAARAPAGVAL